MAAFLPKLDERIRAAYAAQTADGRPVSVPRHALTALALGTDRHHPFLLRGEAAKPIPPTGDPVPPAKAEDPPRPGFVETIKGKFRNLVVRGLGACASRRPSLPSTSPAPRITKPTCSPTLKGQFEHYRPHVPLAGKRVVLKPNLVEYRKAQVINTDPRFVERCHSTVQGRR